VPLKCFSLKSLLTLHPSIYPYILKARGLEFFEEEDLGFRKSQSKFPKWKESQ